MGTIADRQIVIPAFPDRSREIHRFPFVAILPITEANLNILPVESYRDSS